MTRLLLIAALLGMFLAYPRAVLMLAVVFAAAGMLAVRYLLRYRTVQRLGVWSHA